ncbi:aldo-keto reductase, putative [Talaromyces stipitatus ATCC 10500]|uniref:Aldo-keto reductase, putative n=1 Tax=Talaromyces stipitatus (strain ATCC 10500 / CBS 375.48 / QM 6759 / NRRL 1006) TaxID=441959 RepID=B8LST0_TALSN|nr:aldo-keto reductase, putative [Talaromyces stipitatus ATCC 10500]EED22926.1 aldo-keto reductase, putative [Talaromyces stipitatus ATCC 10500]
MASTTLPTSLQKSLDETKVEYTNLGSSGLQISVPILGTMSFGSKEWSPWLLEEEEAIKLLAAAYDRGINTWDTANMYGNGLSEEIISKAIKTLEIPRHKVVIMTKCAIPVGEDVSVVGPAHGQFMKKSKQYVNQGGLSRASIFNQVEASLSRLNTDYIDVLQIHRYDPSTPPEETMKALHDLVQAGKVRYLGASSMWATQFANLQHIAERNGWTKFISMQNYYNLCYREEEREMTRFCKETGVGIIPWSPLFGGQLARPVGVKESIRSQTPSPMGSAFTAADEAIIKRVEQVAKEKGWKMVHVALIWLRSKGAAPIVGATSVEKLDDVVEIRGKSLTEKEIRFLEEPYVPKPIAGHF